MKALDAMRGQTDEQKVRFDHIKPGEVFLHGSRVLIKINDVYELSSGCPPTLDRKNALRLADLNDAAECRRISGLPSHFNADTMVIRRPDAVAYLKG